MQCSFMGSLRQWWTTTVAALLWSLWLCRNEVVFNNKWLPKTESLCVVLDGRARVRDEVCWVAPWVGCLKSNMDGTSRGEARCVWFQGSVARQLG
ncbi:hypothetical protein V6N13_005052 [Hibiscus sabdariffa]